MAVTFALRSPLSASVTSAINYYRCAMQYPADGELYYKVGSNGQNLSKKTNLTWFNEFQQIRMISVSGYCVRFIISRIFGGFLTFGPVYYKDGPIKVPVLSIFGTADKYLSVASAKGTQRYVETLRQEFLEGVGHWVQMESPDQVNKIMSDYLLE